MIAVQPRPPSAVFLLFKSKGHLFDYQDVLILDQEDRWYESGVREVLHRKSLTQQGGDLKYNLSLVYHAALSCPQKDQDHTPERPLLTTVNDP